MQMFTLKRAIGAAALIVLSALGLSPLRAAESLDNSRGQNAKTMTDTAVPSGAIVIDKAPTGSVKPDCRADSKLGKQNAGPMQGVMDKRATCE